MTHLAALFLAAAFASPPQPPPPQELVSQDNLMQSIRALPTARAALGDQASQKGLVQTEELLTKKLTDLGYKPTLQEFKWALPMQPPEEAPKDKPTPDQPPPHPWHNIIVDLRGSDLPNEVVVIGAHFDAVPGAPGADDNGTGTAALLELARVLKDHPTRRTIRLAFFNLEEVGLVGSNNYVRMLRHGDGEAKPAADDKPADAPATKDKIIAMISLEMLGYFTDAPNSQKSPLPPVKDVFEPPTVGDNIALIGLKKDQQLIATIKTAMQKAAPDLKITVVDFLPFPIPDMTRSDHRPFMIAGIPAMMLTDTANFRNPNYHKPTDTIDTIDPKRFTLVVKAVAGAAYELAEPRP